jgi:hypothetical protein
MNEITTKLFVGLVEVLLTAITLLVPALLVRAMGWIKAKRIEIDAGVDADRMNHRQQMIQDAVSVAVSSVCQTYTDDLKAKAADGKLTQEEREESMAKALTLARKHLIPNQIDVATDVLKDHIEEAVRRVA